MKRKKAIPITMPRTLRGALDIHPGEVISLVGAGGKTTLMFSLSRELIVPERLVITTTTTKIFTPTSSDTPYLLISRDEREIIEFILKGGKKFGHITLVSKKINNANKLKGIDPSLVSRLINLGPVIHIIVEADGAARRPLKAPNPLHEPVIPECTTLVIPIVGIDALGCELNEEYVFRSKIAAELTGMALGETVSPDAIASLINHPLGVSTGTPKHARIVPFINKVDLNIDLSQARDVAFKILEAGNPQVDRVVLGHAQLPCPVAEVVYR